MKLPPSLIFIGGGLVAVCSWYAALSSNLYGITVQQLAPLYTGLGFVGLVATFWHERRKSEGAEQEHSEMMNALRSQNKTICHAARVYAISARIDQLTNATKDGLKHRAGIGVNAEKRLKDMLTEKTLLEKTLKEACETTELF